MNKLIPLLAFSILLLVPVGIQDAFANTYNPTTVGPVVRGNFLTPFATFTVSGESSVETVGVRLSMESITHAQAQNLVVSLQSPSFTTVRLHDFSGGAATTIEDVLYLRNLNNCPPTDTCVVIDGPGTFSDFLAEDPNGTWSLLGATLAGPGPGTPDFTVYVNGDSASWGTAIGTQLLINDLMLDSDGDGVFDGEDICQGFDDNVDSDSDGVPDGCDDLDNNDCGFGTIADDTLGQCIGTAQGFDCGPKTEPVSGFCVPKLDDICSTGTIIEPTQMMTCIAQAASSIIGGALLEINSVSLLVGAIGTNPIITGLVGITIAGVAGQVVWFVHRRKKK